METVEPGLAHVVAPRRPARRRIPAPTLIAALIVAIAAASPAMYLLLRAGDGGWSSAWRTLTDGRTASLLIRTAALSATVTAASVAIGVPLAWLTVRTDLPLRRTLSALTALPLVIPSYVGGYAFVAALGPRGIVQGWLEPLGVDRLPEIYGGFGAWLVLTLFSYPYVLLTVRAALRRLDPALEEASLSLGVSRRETFRRVVLPQLRPAVAASALLVALYTLHDFGAVSILRFDSFTRAIYIAYRGSFDRSRAAVLALALVALTMIVVAFETRSRGRAAYYRARVMRTPALSNLGRWRWPAVAACAALVAVAVALPVGVVVYWFTRSVREGEAIRPTLVAAAHSFQASSAAAVAAVIAAWPVAVLSARYRSRTARMVERASFVGYALPGIVVALALVFFGARFAPALYQTIVLLVFAYVVLFLPQASGAVRASLLQIDPSLEEAARALGDGPFARARRVVLPLVRPGALAGMALVFLTVMKELPATLLLAPTGFDTLATRVFSATNAAFFDQAAIPALALVVLASVPLTVLVLRERVPGGGAA